MVQKNGLSQVVSTVLLILLTVGAASAIGAAVINFTRTNLNNAGSCNNLEGKLTLNSEYTCYYPWTNETIISISRNDLPLDSILVSVSSTTSSKSFYLFSTTKNITNVSYYNSKNLNSGVAAPGNESERTYCFNGFLETPTEVQIAPKISNVQCGAVDTINNLPICTSDIASGCA